MKRIEIDITYDCKLRCPNCARSCSQAPDVLAMSPQQIERFINESLSNNVTWDLIGVLGGEPMLHPEVEEILEVLLSYKMDYSPESVIRITTSGYGKVVKDALLRVPKGVEVNNTSKQSPYQEKFEPFNLAPVDQWKFFLSDYRNGCSTTSDCGLGLNAYGYYPCGPGGSIDRVMGFDIGLKKIPSSRQEIISQMDQLCRYCGHFCSRHFIPKEERETIVGSPISHSWISAYAAYEKKKPVLTKY
ncbi:MAG: radical SAM protein [Methanocalculus sp. MSAO_Arc2]|uniref:radical SAM protein n=1 Tax=Methanocalculus sp. MSAO_Arc2 TaxID=2293855 RepID=UPI000FF7210D|nr:MAG: radical SAM protein [Methanocalculus sp. MSAO_Arc2]